MWQPFIGGLVLGFLVLCFYKPEPVILYEYPHPQKVGDKVYRDRAGVCYSYKPTEVNCDANEATLKPYPLQA
jgi:hypothetical protein